MLSAPSLEVGGPWILLGCQHAPSNAPLKIPLAADSHGGSLFLGNQCDPPP